MTNLRQRETVINENIQLKREKAELEKKLTDLMIMLDSKMSLMVDALNQIKDKPNGPSLSTTRLDIPADKKEIRIDQPFIPSPNSSDLKMNVQDLKKTTRKTNLQVSLDKLSQLEEKP